MMDRVRRSLNAVRQRPYTVIAAIVAVAMVATLFGRNKVDWDEVYLPAASRLIRGEDLNREAFAYPPVNAVLALPFVALPPMAGRALWLALNLLALSCVIMGAWRLAGGGRLQGQPPVPRSEHLILCLGLLATVHFSADALINFQTDLFIAALLVGGCTAMVTGRSAWAGVLFGIAAGIKCTPFLMGAYLAWRRRWLGAMLVPVVAVGVNFLPDALYPQANAKPRLQQWGEFYLVPMIEKKHDFGVWACAPINNHSVAGLANRLLTLDLDRGAPLGCVPREGRITPAELKKVALGTSAALVFITLACSLIAGWRSANGVQRPPSREALEFSLAFVLMLMLSPQSSKPHFCTMILPGFCLARMAVTQRSRVPQVVLALAILGAIASGKDLVGKFAYDHLIWYGSVTGSALLLFAGCCYGLARSPRQAAEVPAVQPQRRAA